MSSPLAFGFYFLPGEGEKYALLLSRSIRDWGGIHAKSPIYGIIPENEMSHLRQETVKALTVLGVELVPFTDATPKVEIAYLWKALAAGVAEEQAQGIAEQLVFLDVDSLILKDPFLLILPEDAKIGCRVVDEKNVGLLWEEPIDDFWGEIFNRMDVNQSIFKPVISTVSKQKLRPYYNACLLTVRPKDCLLQRWSSNLQFALTEEEWIPHFTQDRAHEIFFHQAILTGTLLNEMEQKQIHLYPASVNFPLYSYLTHPEYPERGNDLVSCRLNGVDILHTRPDELPMLSNYHEWLRAVIVEYQFNDKYIDKENMKK